MSANLFAATIDETSPLPVHYQVYESIRHTLERNSAEKLPPGARLPNERSLADALGVSRSTLRAALDRLANEGLVVRRQGDGTYVAEPRVEHDLNVLRGFTAEFSQRGKRVDSKILSLQLVRAPLRICELLDVAHLPESVIELRRVRSLDGSPVSLETVWLPAARCLPILESETIKTSLYMALREIGVEPQEGYEELTATTLDEFEASQLEQHPGAPAMLLERLTRDAAGQTVEVVRTILRADRFAVRTNLTLEKATHQINLGGFNDEFTTSAAQK